MCGSAAASHGRPRAAAAPHIVVAAAAALPGLSRWAAGWRRARRWPRSPAPAPAHSLHAKHTHTHPHTQVRSVKHTDDHAQTTRALSKPGTHPRLARSRPSPPRGSAAPCRCPHPKTAEASGEPACASTQTGIAEEQVKNEVGEAEQSAFQGQTRPLAGVSEVAGMKNEGRGGNEGLRRLLLASAPVTHAWQRVYVFLPFFLSTRGCRRGLRRRAVEGRSRGPRTCASRTAPRMPRA
jgi:hypothetical protein